MKLKYLVFAVCFLAVQYGNTQERINGVIPFMNEDKKYSIYVPSSYDSNNPSHLMVGMHPWNVNRWDAESWCDTLIQFSEDNQLLLLCTDGGEDGKVDDLIDTAFTSFVLDSMMLWYNVNPDKVYLMGFSWGGKTVYSYGFNNLTKFDGFMAIGAAVNGTDEIGSILEEVDSKKIYIIHGDNDSPNTRYWPLVNALGPKNCLESILLPGVGHTIDFDNRNAILTEGYSFLSEGKCGEVNTFDEALIEMKVYPNPLKVDQKISIKIPINTISIEILDIKGKVIQRYTDTSKTIKAPSLVGEYILKVNTTNQSSTQIIIVI